MRGGGGYNFFVDALLGCRRIYENKDFVVFFLADHGCKNNIKKELVDVTNLPKSREISYS